MRQALLWVYCTLNFSCRASMSSLTRCISCVWYSRMAPRMWGRTKRALKREKMRNISLAFLAVPSWSLSRLVMRASTRSMRSSYLLTAASQASVPSFEMSSPSTSFTFS
uniref:Putative secreted protein n=1 Tax=Ixodes ricinus TaxID=34613 RepID=A0A6B0UCD0_IXORI